ncbi:ornithine utilization regulator [Bacterioplanes sanyensis]|uniref:helix-turn-helix transcriptional regulator n=1 Tax=Bacterioplanes sanyensis TaxID=1249553 RepID=UPI001675135F|nr:AraC family transcriptional regulator [Bacterioplanes sanyensis]GGY34045.1 ornithine utilization regulator [Bacterioplanes sanyensis]
MNVSPSSLNKQPSRLAQQHLNYLIETLHALGAPTTEISPTQLQLTGMATGAVLQRVIHKVVSVTEEPLLGLIHGARIPLALRGFAGQVFHAASTWENAFSWLIRYVNNFSLLGKFRCLQHEDQLIIEIHQSGNMPVVSSFAQHYLLALLTTLLRDLGGDDALPALVQLKESPQTLTLRYEEQLQLAVAFNQPRNALCLPIDLITRPITGVSLLNRRQAEVECEAHLSAMAVQQDLATRVRSQLLQQQVFPTLAMLAGQLSSSPRTVNRQMAELLTSYQQMVESARCQLAMHYLQNTPLSIDQIAHRLGYNDPSNFGRAFRRWLAVSPRHFRQQQSGFEN